MHEELQKQIAAERKNKRELKELRDLRFKLQKHKQPDQKMLHLIDTEIKHYTEEK